MQITTRYLLNLYIYICIYLYIYLFLIILLLDDCISDNLKIISHLCVLYAI